MLIALALAAAFAYFLRRPLREHAWAFYGMACVIDVLMVADAIARVSPVIARVLFPYLEQSLFAFGLLTIVMLVGVLPEGNLKRSLRPIRGELSIVAALLIAGHVIHYANPMLTRMFFGGLGASGGTFWGTVLSMALIVLLVVLTVTSFKAIRSAMKPATWKRVQMLAYPFYLLVFCHVFAMLFPSAMSGGEKATVNVALYAIVLVVYAVARFARAKKDRYCPDSCANSSRRLPAVGMVTRPAATRPDTASIPTRCRPRT